MDKTIKYVFAAFAGQLAVVGIMFIIFPFYNIFELLSTAPWWSGFPLLLIAVYTFPKIEIQNATKERTVQKV